MIDACDGWLLTYRMSNKSSAANSCIHYQFIGTLFPQFKQSRKLWKTSNVLFCLINSSKPERYSVYKDKTQRKQLNYHLGQT